MKVLGIYGSPRKGGNTDRLLEEALKGAQSAGAAVSAIRPCDLRISGCIECAGCDETGQCVVEDDMQAVYLQLLEAEVIILAAPMFFYGFPAQAKALIDRCQAMWCRRRLNKSPEGMKRYDGGKGYVILAGATKGANLFEGAKLTAKYFFDALDMSFEDGVYVKAVEERGAVEKRPDALEEARLLGGKAVE
jgi:multimeric flavodoxin WrbA